MSWIILTALLLVALIYTLTPLLTQTGTKDGSREREIELIRDQLLTLPEPDQNATNLGTEDVEVRHSLEARLLKLLNAKKTDSNSRLTRLVGILAIGITIGAFVIYSAVGAPNYTTQSIAARQDNISDIADMSLEDLAVALASKLERDPNPPADGYQLLGRTLMSLDEFDAALSAYDKAIDISGGDPSIIAERDRALMYIRSRSGNEMTLPPEVIQNAEQMTPEDQAAMIEGMVNRVSERLTNDPANMDDWQRLLQARRVLGQVQLAQEELATAFGKLERASPIYEQLAAIALANGYTVPE